MPTKVQVARLEERINQLEDAASPLVTVAVFKGETVAFATQRHLQIRPDHVGRKYALEERNYPRDRAHELCAAHTDQELRAAIDAANNQGVSVGFVADLREDGDK